MVSRQRADYPDGLGRQGHGGWVSAHTRQARVEELTVLKGGSARSIVSGGHVGKMERHQPQGHEFEH